MSELTSKTKIIFSLVLFLLLLGLAEFTLRLLKFQVHQPIITEIRSTPSHAIVPHPKLGLTLNPGSFKVHIKDKLQYQATHLADTSRWASSKVAASNAASQIHFYGCSFTYGMGVNDSESYPALLSKEFPEAQIKNFAVPGYGTVHALLQLQQHLAAGLRPAAVVLGYTSLQDARNQLSSIQQKYWKETLASAVHSAIHQMNFPYVEKNEGLKNEGLKIEGLHVKSKALSNFAEHWSWSKRSVLIHLLERSFENIRYWSEDKYELTASIVAEMARLCTTHHIKLVVLALDKSESLYRLQADCQAQGIPFVDAAIDPTDASMTLLPYDSHPNALAHQKYAAKLAELFRQINFDPTVGDDNLSVPSDN